MSDDGAKPLIGTVERLMEKARQREAAHAERTDLDEVPAGHAVAEAAGIGGWNGQHEI